MRSVTIPPIAHPLSASVSVPGSKSLTNRALVIAVLADGTTRVTGASLADDVVRLTEALLSLGFEIAQDAANRAIEVSGAGGRIPVRHGHLFAGNAGTTARFLTALLTLGNGEWVVDGDDRMRERPIGDLVEALNRLGGALHDTRGCPPVKIAGKGLRGGVVRVNGSVSSQFVSAVLMVAPLAQGPVQLEVETALTSRPYVDMTIAVMQAFGVEVQREGYRSFRIAPARYRSPSTYAIEPDASAASYFLAAPAICGGTVLVRGVPRRSLQGDIAFVALLEEMGCEVSHTDDGVRVTGAASLRGVDADMRDIPDTAQTLAAIAPFATTPTRIRGIATARLKETDRIRATCTELGRLGVRVEEHADGMTIHPCDAIVPAAVRTYGDHRMAMAFALIGLRIPGVSVDDPSCVSKSFPEFFDVLGALR
jgi:3-phosphoshikimate 1-carboxyvinyltransferase